MNSKKLKAGDILSETSFFIVESVTDTTVNVKDDLGNKLGIGHKYVNLVLNSADQFDTVEKKTKTELAELFISSPRIAMTVAFYKQDKPKTKTALKKEKAEMVERFQNAKVSEIEGLVQEFIENPIREVIPGDLREMKGRHYGTIDDMGRIQFVDIEQDKGSKPDYDGRLRQVDPRTIQFLIVGGVKYELK